MLHLDIIGNRDIPDEQLIESLADIGVAPGRVLNRSILERLENELLQQYFARGKYSVEVRYHVTTELITQSGRCANSNRGGGSRGDTRCEYCR